MVGNLLLRGMLVGLVAGLLCFGFLKLYGEPQIERAIAFETQMDETKAVADKAKGMDMHKAMSYAVDIPKGAQPALVSRAVQSGVGLFTGVIAYSTAFGGLFALTFAFACGRTSVLSPRSVSALLAATGFVAIYLIPILKYPANPPAVGDSETIGVRTALYFIMIAISIAAMIGSVTLKRHLLHRHGEWNATLIAAAVYFALIAVAGLLLPVINEVPEQFPAAVLWDFRIVSIGVQVIMWATIGLLFGLITHRAATVSLRRN